MSHSLTLPPPTELFSFLSWFSPALCKLHAQVEYYCIPEGFSSYDLDELAGSLKLNVTFIAFLVIYTDLQFYCCRYFNIDWNLLFVINLFRYD